MAKQMTLNQIIDSARNVGLITEDDYVKLMNISDFDLKWKMIYNLIS